MISTDTGKSILIDTSPDLRTQLLSFGVQEMHGAVITHSHADHTHGMDDLRPFAYKTRKDIPIYCDESTAGELTAKFPYIFQRHLVFKDKPVLGGGIPLLNLVTIGPGKHLICGEEIEFFSMPHGHTITLGLRHRGMAYLVDCQEIPSPVIQSLHAAKLDILVIDCLREAPHDTHLHLDLALEYMEKISPKLTILTHMGHEWDYLALVDQLVRRGAKNVIPGIDGTTFLYS